MASMAPTVSGTESGKSNKRWPRAKALSTLLVLSAAAWSAVGLAGLGLVHIAGQLPMTAAPPGIVTAAEDMMADPDRLSLSAIAPAAGPNAVASMGRRVAAGQEDPLTILQEHALVVELAQDPEAALVVPVGYDAAVAMVERLGETVIAMLSNTSLSETEREARFRSLLEDAFDFPAISRIVLGRYWRRATPEQRSEYQQLFQDYIVVTYANRFKSYSGETMVVKGTRPGSNNVTVVRSEIVIAQGGEPVAVDWLVVDRDGEPKIIDVVVAGVSMAITHRSDFAAVINRAGGVDGLLAELRSKIAKG